MDEKGLQAPLPHQPVLYHEIIEALRPHSKGHYVDGTVGAGGHAWGILNGSSPDGLLLGMDVDPQALEIAQGYLAEFGSRAHLIQASYNTINDQIERLGWEFVDGVLLDLGVSSMQLDTASRGFSFQEQAALDMRFDPRNHTTAEKLVNETSESELVAILRDFGEEHKAGVIARTIVKARPIRDTQHLATVVAGVTGRSKRALNRDKKRIHPATRTFQALRIAVNNELDTLESALPAASMALAPGARMIVIAYHSLEDRIVKRFLRRESRDCICPERQPVCTCGHKATLKDLTRRPVRPKDSEVQKNPRSRSARMRVAEKI